MIGFIIKKAFWDTWDNLFKVIILNFLTLPSIGLTYLGLKILVSGNFLGLIFVFISLVVLIIHLGASAYLVRDIGNTNFNSLKDYIKYLKEDFSVKIKFALAWSVFIVVTMFSITFYLGGTGLLSLVPLALVFWFALTTAIATLFFFPIKTRLEGDFKKLIKKSFILLLDNPGAALFTFVYTIVLFVLSVPTIGLLPPGLISILFVVDTTTHMYELKYDYLEANPDADRKKIPWKELYYELNENIGPRSFRSLIFPWKD